jgi:hypothetical protein
MSRLEGAAALVRPKEGSRTRAGRPALMAVAPVEPAISVVAEEAAAGVRTFALSPSTLGREVSVLA